MTQPPKRTLRRTLRIAIPAALVLMTGMSCISYQPAMTGLVTDTAGKPVSDAYVFYTYQGTNHRGMVHAGSYRTGGGVLRTDPTGKIALDARMLFTGPLITSIRPLILAAYAPSRCNGTVESVWAGFDVNLLATSDAATWWRSIEDLRSFFETGSRDEWLELDRAQYRELHDLVVAEYERFRAVHVADLVEGGGGQSWNQLTQAMLDQYKLHRPE